MICMLKISPSHLVIALSVILMLYGGSSVSGQNFTTISGIIVDSHDEPLEYIHVYTKEGVGTFSNHLGMFKLKMQSDQLSDSVVFSSIGFNTKMKLASSFFKSKQDTIVLSSSLTLLKELVVTPQNDGNAIMQKAIKNIPKNYVQKKYSMNAFYRESNIKGGNYSRMFESYALISDGGFKKNLSQTRFKVMQLRKTVNKLDLTDEEKEAEDEVKNGLLRTLSHDRVKRKNGENIYEVFEYDHDLRWNSLGRFFDKDFLKGNDFKITEVFVDKGDTVVQLSSKPIEYNAALGNDNKIYVNLTNYAIVKYEVNYVFFPGYEDVVSPRISKDSNDSSSYKSQIIYRKIAGKYYPHYMKISSLGTNSSWLGERWLANEISGKEVVYQENELFVTQILPYVKIKKKESLSGMVDLYDLDMSNNVGFWRNFSFPSGYILPAAILKDLSDDPDEFESLFIK